MPNEKDINAPIKILLLGSDTNIGEELLSFSTELNEFSLTSLTQENFYQTQFSVSSFEHYDVVLDALSIGADAGDYAQIKACNIMLQEADVSMFMLSSVEVFSGDKGAAYDENEVPDAKSQKGKQLAEIEQLVLKDDNSIVLRSGWLFGCKQQDFVASILSKLKLGEPVLLEDDLLGNPTPISDLVRVAFSLIKQRHFGSKNAGVYHYSCAEDISWFGFGEAVLTNASQFNIQFQASLQATSSSQAEVTDLTLLRKQSLSCRKIFNHFGVKQRPWRASLRNLVKDLYQMN
ncbi:sugar nucleotide-binding protein [Marinomonas sp. PE14-40]|uniref:sugar nucleotide-binding protein n=1 Tax=Marinomonas sp. PE14-40 TaxID=3060621 RepID=UPI003F66996E